MALATMEEFEQFGQVDITNQSDVAVLQYLEDASAMIESYVSRPLEADTGIVQIFDVEEVQSLIRVSTYPLTGITTITENGITLIDGTDFSWTSDGLIRRIVPSSPYSSRPWLRGIQIVTVTYDGGYAVGDIPADIRGVCVRSAFRAFQAAATFANAGGVAVAGVAEVDLGPAGSLTFQDAASMPALSDVATAAMPLTGAEKRILDRHRRRVW